MRHCPYKDAFSSLCGRPPVPHCHLPPPCFFGAQPDQQRTPALRPRSRNGLQFHHQLIKIDRKHKLLLNFYYYYFYPLGSCVSAELVLIKPVVLAAPPCCGSHGAPVARGACTAPMAGAAEGREGSKLGGCLVKGKLSPFPHGHMER